MQTDRGGEFGGGQRRERDHGFVHTIEARYGARRPNGYKGGYTPWQLFERDRPGIDPGTITIPPVLLEHDFGARSPPGQDVPALAVIVGRTVDLIP